MPIKAQFLEGQTEVKVQSLHQWDYGQQLEIEAADIPDSIIEVHFACREMTETIMRSCEIISGIGTVSIPNSCLEQTNPITAWIYEIKKTDGVVTKCTTTKTITIPIIPRIRPGRNEDVPASDINHITELIAQINDAISQIGLGEIIANHAKTADKAGYATNAGFATSAGQINGLLIKRGAKGVLMVDGIVIPQRKLISEEYALVSDTVTMPLYEDTNSLVGRTFELVDSAGVIHRFIIDEEGFSDIGWRCDSLVDGITISLDSKKPNVLLGCSSKGGYYGFSALYEIIQ